MRHEGWELPASPSGRSTRSQLGDTSLPFVLSSNPKHLPGRLVLHSEVSSITDMLPGPSQEKTPQDPVGNAARPPFFSPTWEDSDKINNCHLLDVYECQAGCSTFLSHVTYCISLGSSENHNVYIYDTPLSLVNRQENTEVRSCFKVPQTQRWGTPLTLTLSPQTQSPHLGWFS